MPNVTPIIDLKWSIATVSKGPFSIYVGQIIGSFEITKIIPYNEEDGSLWFSIYAESTNPELLASVYNVENASIRFLYGRIDSRECLVEYSIEEQLKG